MKELSQKKTASNSALPQDGHTKSDQSKDLAKSVDNNIGDSQGNTIAKKASQPKVEKAKAHAESIVGSTFDMTQALTQMRVTIPLVELLKIKEQKEVALSLFSTISDNTTTLPTNTMEDHEL